MRTGPQTILDLKWSFLPPSLGQKQILTVVSCLVVYICNTPRQVNENIDQLELAHDKKKSKEQVVIGFVSDADSTIWIHSKIQFKPQLLHSCRLAKIFWKELCIKV